MFLRKKLTCFFILFIAITTKAEQLSIPKPSLIFFDTTNRELCVNKPFTDVINQFWNLKYVPLDKMMDMDLSEIRPEDEQSVFFVFGIEFLKGLQSSPISQKVIQIAKKYSTLPNKLIGLCFPSITINPEINLVATFKPIFEPFLVPTENGLDFTFTDTNFTTTHSQNNDLKAFTFLANNFLARPLESRPRKYHTTLSFPNIGMNFYTNQIKQALAENKDLLKFLPQSSGSSEIVNETTPYGLYFNNKNNHILLVNNSLLSFSGITESCHFCPMDFNLRNEFLGAMSNTITQATNLFFSSQINSPSMPKTVSFYKLNTTGQCLNSDEPSLKKTAWMELNIFEPQDLDVAATTTQLQSNRNNKIDQQKQLIKYIVNSKIDTLWLSICPNCYYSPIARQKDNEKKMLETVKNFTAQLKNEVKESNASFPKILIGFEIANNLYDKGLPKIFAVDVYGNNYQDIPDPLDEDFWKNEVKIPFAKFVEQWNKPEIGNNIAISGVMIDLEMYCRKTSGIFLTTMGITQNNFTEFFKEQNLKPGPMTFNAGISFLMNNKLSQKYFTFLENKACNLGTQLKNAFEKQIPDCIVALYMPNILCSWFYKGLYKGLSRPNQPLYLFSFNAEFGYHKEWFTNNNIKAHHSSVLLLSKLSNSDSFKLTADILKHHNGVWLNRFSRLIEPKSNDWTMVEKPMFPEHSRQKLTSDFIEYLSKI
ncbi:MAG: hypothetical protein US49_C0005G0043 [candidate division TM6 bacterium GW2011_GWF2_37_49]|nr:MAG: hypothetical protein US49_C0005G0043 [candidate division TM6 bacterium GW2011_GWF2_37_49]